MLCALLISCNIAIVLLNVEEPFPKPMSTSSPKPFSHSCNISNFSNNFLYENMPSLHEESIFSSLTLVLVSFLSVYPPSCNTFISSSYSFCLSSLGGFFGLFCAVFILFLEVSSNKQPILTLLITLCNTELSTSPLGTPVKPICI